MNLTDDDKRVKIAPGISVGRFTIIRKGEKNLPPSDSPRG